MIEHTRKKGRERTRAIGAELEIFISHNTTAFHITA